MKTTLAALLAPIVAISLLSSAVAYGQETDKAHAAALIKAPLVRCVAHELTAGSGGTVQICTVVAK